jgi:flagellar hook-length control protein FliK
VTISGDLRDWIRPIPVAVTAADVAQASKNIEQFAVSLAGKPMVSGDAPVAPIANATIAAPTAGVTALSTGSSTDSSTGESGQGSMQSPVAPASDAKGEEFSLNLAESRVTETSGKSSVASPNQDSSLDALNTYAVVETDDLDEAVIDTSTGDASASELGVDDISSPTINRTESKEIREGIDRGIRESTEALMKMAEERRPGQITVRMMPEDLGIIEVTLSQFGTRFDIDVQATDDRVRSSMNAHRNDLVQNLETRGVNVGSFNVSDQTKGDMTQQQQRHQQEGLLREDLQRAANLNSWETPAPISTPAPSYAVANRQAVDVTA